MTKSISKKNDYFKFKNYVITSCCQAERRMVRGTYSSLILYSQGSRHLNYEQIVTPVFPRLNFTKFSDLNLR